MKTNLREVLNHGFVKVRFQLWLLPHLPLQGEVHLDLEGLVRVRDLADLPHREGEVQVHLLGPVLLLV